MENGDGGAVNEILWLIHLQVQVVGSGQVDTFQSQPFCIPSLHEQWR